jgi:hypothetical protein
MISIYDGLPLKCIAANDDCMGRGADAVNTQQQKWTHSSHSTPLQKFNTKNSEFTFNDVAKIALEREVTKCAQGEITKQTFGMFQSRLRSKILPFFQDKLISDIDYGAVAEFINYLHENYIKPITIKQYLGLLRRILNVALEREWIYKIPLFPKIKAKSTPRGSFTCREYREILKASRRLSRTCHSVPDNHRVTSGGAYMHRDTVPLEMTWLIQFMVNSFVRPVDIKIIKHKHVELISGANTYLRLSLPKTKAHTGQIVTLRAGAFIYERLKQYQESRGYGGAEDYLFLPEARDRGGAIQLITSHFRKILKKSGCTIGQEEQTRTLYSLRHTAITFRLLYGHGIDLLTLARNARTSVEMIERFYSSNLTAEMNIEMLQSKRTAVKQWRQEFPL